MVTPTPFRTRVVLRWADIDANFHLRHSVYYDLCAQQRMEALNQVGITLEWMRANHIGPVLFREECIFRREIKLDDEVYLDLAVRPSDDPRRFSVVHTFTKADGTYCATLTVEGAWMDTVQRRLTPAPTGLQDAMKHLPPHSEQAS
jgi:acyl-CoA thioester hydrolase